MKARWLFLAVALLAGRAWAQSPGEISFWESVRDSKDPAELRAYLQQYPNGAFAVLAKRRVEALEKKPVSAPAAPASPATAAAPILAGQKRNLQAGDSWTYRLSYPRVRGQWGQTARAPATLVVTLTSAQPDRITDAVSVDGGTPRSITHEPKPTLLEQGADIFSPYPFALGKMPATGWFRSVSNIEPGCARRFICESKARIAGSETVQVPAGSFVATKVILEEEWRWGSGQLGARGSGGRVLTIWYAPEIGRAVKYASRVTVSDQGPVEPTFDLELVSYQLK